MLKSTFHNNKTTKKRDYVLLTKFKIKLLKQIMNYNESMLLN